MARVVLEHLTKVFQGPRGEGIRAVDDASLTIGDKEFVVLVGPSGCGKTTTLRLIAGLEEATSGSVSIDGQPMKGVAPKERDVAMVFQNHALYPHMSAYENMAFGLKLRKLPQAEIQNRVKAAAEMLDLSNCLDRRPPALSGGQRQRVALGRAIVRRPKVFLFDEPLSNLDAQMRAQMRKEIAKLHARLAATMIYVTHDQVEAMTMGERIAVMKEGVIQQVAEPMNLYQHPASLFVAGFIGSPPMNFFEHPTSNIQHRTYPSPRPSPRSFVAGRGRRGGRHARGPQSGGGAGIPRNIEHPTSNIQHRTCRSPQPCPRFFIVGRG